MALPATGPMKASMIRTELKATGRFDINATNYRKLARRTSGVIKFSDFRGKSSKAHYTYRFRGSNTGTIRQASFPAHNTGSIMGGTIHYPAQTQGGLTYDATHPIVDPNKKYNPLPSFGGFLGSGFSAGFIGSTPKTYGPASNGISTGGNPYVSQKLYKFNGLVVSASYVASTPIEHKYYSPAHPNEVYKASMAVTLSAGLPAHVAGQASKPYANLKITIPDLSHVTKTSGSVTITNPPPGIQSSYTWTSLADFKAKGLTKYIVAPFSAAIGRWSLGHGTVTITINVSVEYFR